MILSTVFDSKELEIHKYRTRTFRHTCMLSVRGRISGDEKEHKKRLLYWRVQCVSENRYVQRTLSVSDSRTTL